MRLRLALALGRRGRRFLVGRGVLRRFLIDDLRDARRFLVGRRLVPRLARRGRADLPGHGRFVVRPARRGGRLRGLLEQVGHRRHAVARDVLEDLQHLGPFLEMAHAELGIAGGLPHEVFAGRHEVRQAPAVGPLGAGLRLDAAARFGPVELLRTHGPQLLIRLEQLQFAVADVERLTLPLGQLLGEPDRVLLRIENVEDIRRRIDARPPGEIILGKDLRPDYLRLDIERLGGKRPRDLEVLFVVSAARQNAFAFGRSRHGRLDDAGPFEPHAFDAEIVLGADLERERFGIEHDFQPREPFAGERRRLVLAPRDRQGERLLPRQAETVLPAEFDLGISLHADRRAGRRVARRRVVFSVNREMGQLAARRRHEPHMASIHRREHAAADVFRLHRRQPQVFGERDFRDRRGQFGACHRLDPHVLPPIADREGQRLGRDLRRHLEFVASVGQGSGNRLLTAQLGEAFAGLGDRLRFQLERQRKRLAVRDDDPVVQRLDGGKCVPRRGEPRTQQPRPGIGACRRKERQQDEDGNHGHSRDRDPHPVPRMGNGIPEVALLGVFGHLPDGGDAQRAGAGLLEIVPHELDDSQKLIPDASVLAAQQAGQLFQVAIPPDPAMGGQGNGRATYGRRGKQGAPRPDRRFPDPVENEQGQKGDQHAEQGAAARLDHLDRPDALAELVKLLLECAG